MPEFTATCSRQGVWHVATCPCGWEVRYRARTSRDRAAAIHESDHRRGWLT